MTPAVSISVLLPEILLLVGGCAVLLLGTGNTRRLAPWTALVTLVLALVVTLGRGTLAAWWGHPLESGSGLAYGTLAGFVRLAALELGILLTLVNWSQARDEERGEFLSMMLFSLCGLLLVGAADNLLMLFLALELTSIPTYIMIVLSRSNPRALESGTKYFYLGAMSAAIMAYGFSFLYGVAGTASMSAAIPAITAALAHPGTLHYGLALIGCGLALGGLLFKIAAVPLHFYVADVYQGAASPVAGLLGFVPKLAGLVAIFKLLLLTGYWYRGQEGIFWTLWLIAVVSMTVGNVLALRQTNIKRMLAYSGVAHAGYMLVGIIAGPEAGQAVAADGVGILGDGTAAVLYYVVIYGIANLTAFAVLGLLRNADRPSETLRDVAGLLRREPGAALLLALAMITLMGLPPTPGFWGKLSLFGSALTASQLTGDTRLVVLVIIAVLNSALAAAYYLRVIAAVLLYDSERPARAMPAQAPQIGALLCGFLLLIFALYPTGLMSAGQVATHEIRERSATIAVEEEPATGMPVTPGAGSTPAHQNSSMALSSMFSGRP